ncbi:hypothetical protein AGMMS49942_09480 [Spirochaetia bacterium]|nr:hypothetical protein AGMMS49942_09480 [Spirochaetia bacterium]
MTVMFKPLNREIWPRTPVKTGKKTGPAVKLSWSVPRGGNPPPETANPPRD